MYRHITNCIRKIRTESDNLVIFWYKYSEPISDTFVIWIFLGSYISEPNYLNPRGPKSKSTHKFIISKTQKKIQYPKETSGT